MQKKKDSKKKTKIIFFILIFIIIILLLGRSCSKQNSRSDIEKKDSLLVDTTFIDSVGKDTLKVVGVDSTSIKDSINQYKSDSVNAFLIKEASIKKEKLLRKTQRKLDSLQKIDSLKNIIKIFKDSISPYVYLNPPSGLYKNKIKVSIKSDEEKVKKYYRFSIKNKFTVYNSEIEIKDSTKISFFGIDSAGNSTDTLTVEYHINKEKNPCEKNMIYIKTQNICIDKYEWPNKKEKKPLDFISLYGAMDSCASVEKRLCTEKEWKEAAGGNLKKYPYGEKYSRRKCNTDSGRKSKSGEYKECRSYYGTYDMVGNLSEWTSTKDVKNPTFNRVYGGNFSSTSTATSRNYKFSYFPTNKYVGVGFRCCKNNK